MLKLLLFSIALLIVVSAQASKEQRALCTKELSTKVKAETDISLKIALISALSLQATSDNIVNNLSPQRIDRVKNYYFNSESCKPFQTQV